MESTTCSLSSWPQLLLSKPGPLSGRMFLLRVPLQASTSCVSQTELMNGRTDGGAAGVSCMCWLVNCVHVACLHSEPAVKEQNIHDLYVYLQACAFAEVLKTSDGFPSYTYECVCVEYRPQCCADFPWVEATPLMISRPNSIQTWLSLQANVLSTTHTSGT